MGFPTARVEVYVNDCPLLEVRVAIEKLSRDVGATFNHFEPPIRPQYFYNFPVMRGPVGTVVFVDPDITFWENVEGWHFDALLAGRLIPAFRCEVTKAFTHPRLHSSFLWIEDIVALRNSITEVHKEGYFDFDPFNTIVFKQGGDWHRFDCGGILYSVFKDRMRAFSERELNAYDHLFCGTHFDFVRPKLVGAYGKLFERLHDDVQKNPQSLKGAWKMQEKYFASRSPAQRRYCPQHP